MWWELIKTASPDYALNQPIREQEIYFVERALGVEFPETLRQLLQEANGGTDQDAQWVLWELAKIEKGNQELRHADTHMPVHHLLFFAEDGNHNLYAFGIIGRTVRLDRVYLWRRDDDSRICVANSLEEFLERWLEGKVTV